MIGNNHAFTRLGFTFGDLSPCRATQEKGTEKKNGETSRPPHEEM